MIRTRTALAIVAASLLPAAALAQSSAPGDVQQGMERAIAKAAEGPQALRMFIFNTRGLYGLYYPNVIREVELRKAAPKAQVAQPLAVAQAKRRD